MKKTLATLLLVCGGFGVHAASPATDTFQVMMTIEPTCVVTANGNVDFGSVTTDKRDSAASTTVTVNCSLNTAYTVGLLPSNNDAFGAGEMSGPGGPVDYQLRTQAGSSGTPWGDDPTRRVSGTGTANDQTLTVHATVPSANVVPGSYSDTVTVKVYF